MGSLLGETCLVLHGNSSGCFVHGWAGAISSKNHLDMLCRRVALALTIGAK